MSEQQIQEIIKALAYGETPEQAAEAEGESVAAVQQIIIDDAAEIAAEREVLKKAGYLRASAAGPPREFRTASGEPWIDVSAHQGTVDWAKVKAAGIKGAVVRAGYGNDPSQQDVRFAANIAGAQAAGLKTAVYWFSYADSIDDAIKEWGVCQKIIGPYKAKIRFVASDYEYDSMNYYRRIHGTNPTNALINQMVMAFRGAAKAAGWKTAIYTNNDYRRNIFTVQTLSAFDYIWLADYTGAPDIACAMQQTGSTGTVSGIAGNVDMDTAFSPLSDPVANPPYTCDTAGDTTNPVVIARGAAYQARITCQGAPRVAAGTGDIVTVLPRYDSGDDHYYYFVPIGKSGDMAGIYINGGPRQFVVKVK